MKQKNKKFLLGIASLIGVTVITPICAVALNACSQEKPSVDPVSGQPDQPESTVTENNKSKVFDTSMFSTDKDFMPYVRSGRVGQFVGNNDSNWIDVLIVPEKTETLNLDLTMLKNLNIRFKYIIIPASVTDLTIKADDNYGIDNILYGQEEKDFPSFRPNNLNQLDRLNVELSNGKYTYWDFPYVKSGNDSSVKFKLDIIGYADFNLNKYSNVFNVDIELSNSNSSISLPRIVDKEKFKLSFNNCRFEYLPRLPDNLETIKTDLFNNCYIENITIPSSIKTIEPFAFSVNSICNPSFDNYDKKASSKIVFDNIDVFRPYFKQSATKAVEMFSENQNSASNDHRLTFDFRRISNEEFYYDKNFMFNLCNELNTKIGDVLLPDFASKDPNYIRDSRHYEKPFFRVDSQENHNNYPNGYPSWPY